jgi:hypothetical protein
MRVIANRALAFMMGHSLHTIEAGPQVQELPDGVRHDPGFSPALQAGHLRMWQPPVTHAPEASVTREVISEGSEITAERSSDTPMTALRKRGVKG